MNKRQAKKDEFKHMWLTAYTWKQYRKNCKANARHQAERKWKV